MFFLQPFPISQPVTFLLCYFPVSFGWICCSKRFVIWWTIARIRSWRNFFCWRSFSLPLRGLCLRVTNPSYTFQSGSSSTHSIWHKCREFSGNVDLLPPFLLRPFSFSFSFSFFLFLFPTPHIHPVHDPNATTIFLTEVISSSRNTKLNCYEHI